MKTIERSSPHRSSGRCRPSTPRPVSLDANWRWGTSSVSTSPPTVGRSSSGNGRLAAAARGRRWHGRRCAGTDWYVPGGERDPSYRCASERGPGCRHRHRPGGGPQHGRCLRAWFSCRSTEGFAGVSDVSPDGERAVLTSRHGAVIWSLSPEDWISQACALTGRNLHRSGVGDLLPERRPATPPAPSGRYRPAERLPHVDPLPSPRLVRPRADPSLHYAAPTRRRFTSSTTTRRTKMTTRRTNRWHKVIASVALGSSVDLELERQRRRPARGTQVGDVHRHARRWPGPVIAETLRPRSARPLRHGVHQRARGHR